MMSAMISAMIPVMIFVMILALGLASTRTARAAGETPCPSLREAEALDALADSAGRQLATLYRRVAERADRFGAKAGTARALARWFEARAHASLGRDEEARVALEAAAQALFTAGDSEGAEACRARAGFPPASPASAELGGLPAGSIAQAMGGLKRRLAALAATRGIESGGMSADKARLAALRARGDEPDARLVIGRTKVGDREVEDALRFDDAMRFRVAATLAARIAMASAPEGPERDRAAALAKGPAAAAKSPAVTDPALPPATAAILARARAGEVSSADVELVRAALEKAREASGPGTVGRRRFRAKHGGELWALAVVQAAAGRGGGQEGRQALAALGVAEEVFRAGARGDVFAHPDPRFPFELADLYLQAHRYRDALSYLYDADAILARYPEATALRHATTERDLLETLGTRDGKLAARESGPGESSPMSSGGDGLRLAGGSLGAAPPKPRSGGSAAWWVVGGGVLLLALAGWSARKA